MISSSKALKIVLDNTLKPGTEKIPLFKATGRCLAQSLKTDRDFPPFNRVAMDGIAIKFSALKKNNSTFIIQSTQYAGDAAHVLRSEKNCIEIMTGGVLPNGADTVIQYEHLEIQDATAVVIKEVRKGQNIHKLGSDKKKGEVLLSRNRIITAAEIATLATLGITKVEVVKPPKTIVISTGNELVDIDKKPKAHQIRMSNSYMIHSFLQDFMIDADLIHLPDHQKKLKAKINSILKTYDLIIISGGVSAGKADYIPRILEELGVVKLFHKVSQRPGKPFWFGKKQSTVIFAFPGNPISSFVGFMKYCKPFILKSYGVDYQAKNYAQLNTNFKFKPNLTYFLQVAERTNIDGILKVKPVIGNGSGDLANLLNADGLLELPASKTEFKKGEIYPYYSYRETP